MARSQGDQTPLHLAAELDAKDCVSVLLAAKAAVEPEDGQLRTPLSLACESKAFESAQMLITGGASLSATDKNDTTPLHWMASYGQASGALALIRLAIAKGADINATNVQMQTPLHFAITKGNVECALALVDAGASLTNEDEMAGTMMHLAMQYAGSLAEGEESLELLQRLLKTARGKADVKSQDREKRTPLHWAAGKNALPCVSALLAAGADPNARDWAEHTPLHWACLSDALESVKALVAAGSKVDAVDRDKRTPLHWAADRGAEGVLHYLVEGTKSPIDSVDYAGYSALHKASARGLVDSVTLLIKKGANPNLAALSGETPVDVAADTETKKTLLKSGSSPALKRKRSLSGGRADLEGTLPSLAETLYKMVGKNDMIAIKTLCVDPVVKKLTSQAKGQLAKAEVGSMHVSTRTCTVHVDLKLAGGGSALHKLTFDQDGLISASDIFADAS